MRHTNVVKIVLQIFLNGFNGENKILKIEKKEKNGFLNARELDIESVNLCLPKGVVGEGFFPAR